MDQEGKQTQECLDAFLVDNHELEALDARLKRFNIFEILKVSHVELRHSNMLAWLLDPAGSHGLGDAFVRRFLSRLLRDKPEITVSLTPVRVELMEFDDIEVLREWHNVDVLVHSRLGGWVLLIENKIGASESPGQLVRYAKAIQEEWGARDVIPVFLTLDGDDPSEDGSQVGFVALSWVQVLQLLERLVTQHSSKIPSEAKVLLEHYLNTLRRLTMQDQELIDLCKAIYRKHKEAINFIVEYGSASQVLDICERTVAAFPNLALPPVRMGKQIWFLPKSMVIEGIPPLSMPWGPPGNKYPIFWWFYWDQRKGGLYLRLEAGPIEDREARQRLMHLAQEAGFKPQKDAFRKEAKYSRLLTEIRVFQKDDDGEPNEDESYVQDIVSSLWKSSWTKGSKIVQVLEQFGKPDLGGCKS